MSRLDVLAKRLVKKFGENITGYGVKARMNMIRLDLISPD